MRAGCGGRETNRLMWRCWTAQADPLGIPRWVGRSITSVFFMDDHGLFPYVLYGFSACSAPTGSYDVDRFHITPLSIFRNEG